MRKIWLTSDLHFGHDKEFIWGPRGFNSVEEHDQAIIKNWNEIVSDEDEVWVLGDLMLNDNDAGIRKLNQLKGNIRILYGNHDSATRVQLYANIRPTILGMGLAYILKYRGYSFYLSHYQTITSNIDDNKKPLNKILWNIHGHTHSKEKFSSNSCCYNVCLDAHNCSPILLDDIINDINKKYPNSQWQKR